MLIPKKMRNYKEEVKDKAHTLICPKCKQRPMLKETQKCVKCSLPKSKENKSK